jgi:hypothetical protein
MGECSDCDSDKECRGDHGTFDDSRDSDTITSDPQNCYYEDSTDYEYVHTVNPMEGDHAYNEVDDWTNIYLNGYFTNRPSKLIDEEQCDYNDEAHPASIEFVIEHPDYHDDNDYKFRDPLPENDSEAGGVMGIVLAITASAAPHPVVRAGAAAAAAWVNTQDYGSGVDFESNQIDGNRQQFWWDVDVSGDKRDDFPQSPCDTNCVRFELDHNTSGSVDVKSWSRYTMAIPEYDNWDGCPCDYQYQFYHHKTGWAGKKFEMKEA